MGNHVLVAKDQDEAQSLLGIVIPEQHREYRRRGWVIAAGDGVMKKGRLVPPPYKPGDYIYADRRYVRPDEREDEIAVAGEGVVVLWKGEDVQAYVSPVKKGEPTFGVTYKFPPAWASEAIKHFAKGAAK